MSVCTCACASSFISISTLSTSSTCGVSSATTCPSAPASSASTTASSSTASSASSSSSASSAVSSTSAEESSTPTRPSPAMVGLTRILSSNFFTTPQEINPIIPIIIAIAIGTFISIIAGSIYFTYYSWGNRVQIFTPVKE